MFERFLARIMPAQLLPGALAARHLPLIIFAYCCLLPRELQIEIFDAAFFPYRVILLLAAPFAIGSIARSPVRPSLFDLLIIFAALWIPIALYFTTSLEAGLTTGMSWTLDLGLAYLIGRAGIRTPQDFRTVFLVYMPGLLLTVGILALESLSHRLILRPTLATLAGYPIEVFTPHIRFGLLRALGPFPQAILGGVFLASILPLAWYVTHNNWQRLVAATISLGGIFTVSSAAILGLLIAALLIVFDVIQRLYRLPIFLAAGFYAAISATLIEISTEGGLISFLVQRLTFDSQTGFYRMLIWEYGGAEAMAHPLFGIGQRDWIRPVAMANDTVDSYWLLLAMYYGFPAMVAPLLAMIGVMIALLRTQKYRHSADQDCIKGIVFFFIIVIFAGVTVHLWENVHAWIYGMLGAAVSLATQARSTPLPHVVSGKPGQFEWIAAPFRKPDMA